MEQSTSSTPADLASPMKPLAVSLGMASPLWMAYGAAASFGATWWWMSRMSRFVSPALADTPVAERVQTVLEAVEQAAPVNTETVAERPIERPDELTLIRGVGPRVADALVARGVTTFGQLASWTEHDMAHFDKALKLLGRSRRYDFLGQARELAERVA